jgi:hypothetical protein
MARVIFYGPSPAAIAAERVYLLPPLDETGLEHPLGRFVAWMALYAHRVEHGDLPGPYEPEAAERYARRALIDEHELRELADLDDPALAEHFEVPVEQIHFRRIDLGLAPGADPGGHGNGVSR